MISIGLHVAAILAAWLLLVPRAGTGTFPRVEISLSAAPGSARRGVIPTGTSAISVPARRLQAGIAPADPGAAFATSLSGTGSEMPFPSAAENPGTNSLPAPSVSDVLADAASLSPQASGSPEGTWVGWQGAGRTLIRKRSPEFPTVLSAMGQEIELEARISVAPSGIVTRVEITRSSGYIEIDASVEAALRDYLYSRVDGRTETAGTIRFRFRLEKQD
jgi:TonB family protein